MKRLIQYILLFVFFFSYFHYVIKAEGTKEIMPHVNYVSRIEIHSSFSEFAYYNAPPEYKLYITIHDPSEKVFFGFGRIFDYKQNSCNDVKFRIKDSDGKVVFAEQGIPAAGTGMISTYAQAVAGPDVINNSGYNPLVFSPSIAGDYFIEFYFEDNTYSERREFEFFDITVADENNTPIPGRIWSKAWQFTTTYSSGDGYENPFYGKMFVYSGDGVVSSVDLNGIKPFVFTLCSNQTGCENTGNLFNDRRSKSGKFMYPQYKLFLNNPDPVCFPTGEPGDFTGIPTFTYLTDNSCYFTISCNKSGTVEIFINLNGVPGYQPNSKDVMLVKSVNAGNNIIHFNGKDGLGNLLPSCIDIETEIVYYNGITHLPLHDAEKCEQGIIVNIIRPVSESNPPPLFWDDTEIDVTSYSPPYGCMLSGGCHHFENFFGDLNTINTWWFTGKKTDTILINFGKVFVDADINNTIKDNTFCFDAKEVHLKGQVIHALSGVWSSNGSGVFSPDPGVLDAVYFLSPGDKQKGSVLFTLTSTDNQGCPEVSDSVRIFIETPYIEIEADTLSGCSPLLVHFTETSGYPFSMYSWNSDHSGSSFSLTKDAVHVFGKGKHVVTLTAGTLHGCDTSASIEIIVFPKPVALFTTRPDHADIFHPEIFFFNQSFSTIASNFWDFGDGNSFTMTDLQEFKYVYDTSGTFPVTLVVENEYGCYDTVSQDVIIHEHSAIYVPNAFTPDGDGINDIFLPSGSGITSYRLLIYDRWGEKVFESDRLKTGWNGMIKGKGMAETGSYTWLITYRNVYDLEYQKIGTLTLIR